MVKLSFSDSLLAISNPRPPVLYIKTPFWFEVQGFIPVSRPIIGPGSL